MAVLSREEFDTIEFDAAVSGDHAAAARQMSLLAATGAEGGEMPRAEAFLRAGEQWMLADHPAEAVTGFRRAMAEGGPVFAEPRVSLARALFLLGRTAEAQAIIRRLKAESPSDPRICDMVAELLVERSDLPGALDWATEGVRLCLSLRGGSPETGQRAASSGPNGSGADSELGLLLSLRYRIRNDLGLPEDDFDRLLDES